MLPQDFPASLRNCRTCDVEHGDASVSAQLGSVRGRWRSERGDAACCSPTHGLGRGAANAVVATVIAGRTPPISHPPPAGVDLGFPFYAFGEFLPVGLCKFSHRTATLFGSSHRKRSVLRDSQPKQLSFPCYPRLRMSCKQREDKECRSAALLS